MGFHAPPIVVPFSRPLVVIRGCLLPLPHPFHRWNDRLLQAAPYYRDLPTSQVRGHGSLFLLFPPFFGESPKLTFIRPGPYFSIYAVFYLVHLRRGVNWKGSFFPSCDFSLTQDFRFDVFTLADPFELTRTLFSGAVRGVFFLFRGRCCRGGRDLPRERRFLQRIVPAGGFAWPFRVVLSA